MKVTFIFRYSQQQFVLCLCGDRALNSAPNQKLNNDKKWK